MLVGDDLARRRRELRTELAAPGAGLEALALPSCPLDRCHVLPALIVADPVAMMHGEEDPHIGRAGGDQDLVHVRDAVVRLGHRLDPRPDLPALGNEIVIGIDHQESGFFFLVGKLCHRTLPQWPASAARSMLAANRGVSPWLWAIDAGWRWVRNCSNGMPCRSRKLSISGVA